jgi:hypothetical protein
MSLKNKWRTRGALQFRRETRRFTDGSPYGGDVLFIRIRGKACVIATTGDDAISRPGQIWCNDGLYFCKPHVAAAKQLRAALHAKAASR